jgi:FimV-like protein
MLKSSQAVFESVAPGARSISRCIAKRVFATSLAASALAWSTLASALGLGEITLHSALNQPLNAEIQLTETGGLSSDDIVVRLASPESYAKAGIERGVFLNDLRFTPVVRGDRGVIRVVSSKAVTEPYLNFLVQLSRPNGDLLHEYTLLFDPATSAAGVAATRSRQQSGVVSADSQSRMPVAPPAAVKGQRYTVANGDTLNRIAQRVQGRGTSASQMAEGIRALNPQAFTDPTSSALKAGQSLLLPDAAVLPAAAAPAAAAQATDLQKAAEQLAASTLESQQLARTVEELTARAQALQEEMAGKDKEITALRADLAQSQAAPPTTAPAPTTAAPVAAPAPVAVAEPSVTTAPAEPFLSLPLLLAVLALVVLLVAYAISRRRQQRKPDPTPVPVHDESLIKPAQTPVVPIYEVPAVAPQPAPAAGQSPARAPASTRLAGAAPDALDGVSIYIAYGRFSEALGILRSALETEPQREDIRIRILELLAEQGDVTGFAREEQSALEYGVERQKIEDIRARYPQLKASEAPPAPAPVVAPVPAPVDELPDLQLDETTAAALNPEHIDEFQLNLDDLSLDADWDLVDPFDTPATRGKQAAPVAAPAPEVDPAFASNLTELPEVFELSDEQFLSDFDEPEQPAAKDDALDPAQSGDDDALSDEFLDSFMGDDSEFDLLDLEEPPLTQINEAQMLIDEGDFDAARSILERVIEESDEQHRQMARELLAGIR